MWYKTSNRKPYYDLKQSFPNFFQEHVRFIRESNTIESAFEKPYSDEDSDYNKMHLRGSGPTAGGGGDPLFDQGCAFVKNPTPEQSLIFSGVVVNNVNPSYGAGPFNIVLGSGEGTWYRTCIFCVEPECPNYSFSADVEEGSFSVSFGGETGKTTVSGAGSCIGGAKGCNGVIPPNACAGKDYLEFDIHRESNDCAAHGGSSSPQVCDKHETIPCDLCKDVITFTQSSGDTATKDQKDIAVSFSAAPHAGTAPYTWTISGTGAVLDSSSTTVPENTFDLTDSCGSITIVMTDACGYIGTAYVRVATGFWCLIEQCGISYASTSMTWHCPKYEIVGKYRYWVRYCYCSPVDSPVNCNSRCGASCHPECSSPIAICPATNPYYSVYQCMNGSAKWEWKCAC